MIENAQLDELKEYHFGSMVSNAVGTVSILSPVINGEIERVFLDKGSAGNGIAVVEIVKDTIGSERIATTPVMTAQTYNAQLLKQGVNNVNDTSDIASAKPVCNNQIKFLGLAFGNTQTLSDFVIYYR
jgi:hypothetical protein